MKILITAFLPFNKSNNNYSIEVLKLLNNVDRLIIDVNYDKCFEEINQAVVLDDYDYIIALGEARSRNEILVERQAINLSSCSIPDNSGVLKKDEKIDLNGKEYLETNIDLKQFEGVINISNDCGKFVCNNLYYHLLSYNPNKCLFIHIPHCHDDINEYYKYKLVLDKVIEILKTKND